VEQGPQAVRLGQVGRRDPGNTGPTYGQEQAGHVTVQLTSPKGTPTGKVDITAGRTTVCIIKAARGTGSCHLTAKRVKPGGYLFQATYTGSVNYIPAPVATIAVEVAN
jgi:hypothetical protein